ncbi:MAG: nicotinamide-nucleotide amidohydrolase family protein [Streptosporangiales bacterium]|nr:nicotinamide-nucleotide amidohydrolase family protein [Streptosporangiales bacterium]
MAELFEDALAELRAAGATLAVAESLTGGLVGATVTDVPGASAVFRGGVIAYATDVKASVLGVDRELLATHGAVHPEVARQLATGVRELLQATYGLALTGVAGPDPQDGQPPGTVYVAVAGPAGTTVTALSPEGQPTRPQVRQAATEAACRLLLDAAVRS